LKATLNAALRPGARVRGRFNLLTVKPVPATFACDMVTLAVPELVNVAVRFWTWPVRTLPKFRLEGFEIRALDPTASADTDTLTTELGASLVTATDPLAAPVDCGAKVTENVFFCPGDKVRGKLRPLIRKPRPVTVACLRVTLEVPELTSVAD